MSQLQRKPSTPVVMMVFLIANNCLFYMSLLAPTPSVSSVESTVSIIEASGMKSYCTFKDWIDPSLFVIKSNNEISAVIKPIILQCSVNDLAVSHNNCINCQSGEGMREIFDMIDWVAVKSGSITYSAAMVSYLVDLCYLLVYYDS